MRRTISLCLSLLMLAAVLSACGGKTESPEQTTAADTIAVTAPETEYIDTLGEKFYMFDLYISRKYDLKPTTRSNYQFNYDHFIRDGFGQEKMQ